MTMMIGTREIHCVQRDENLGTMGLMPSDSLVHKSEK